MSSDALKLAEALAVSTPGVWILSDRDGPYVRVVDGIRWLGDAMTVEDARLFVEAHNRLPSLLTEIENLRAERGALLADADASQHWQTRALRAEAALEETRALTTAWNDGASAQCAGLDRNACPYPPDSEKGGAWLGGWTTDAWRPGGRMHGALTAERDALVSVVRQRDEMLRGAEQEIATLRVWRDRRAADLKAIADATEANEALKGEVVRLRALRAYVKRSIADDLTMDEACDLLDELAPEDMGAVKAWAEAMADPTYWSADIKRLTAERDHWREKANHAQGAYAAEYGLSVARNLGAFAYEDGGAVSACPYAPDSDNAVMWRAGWRAVACEAERDEMQRTLWAERGDPRGAPDPAWTWVGDGWGREYPNGECAEVYRGRWYRALSGQPPRAAGKASTMRAGMIDCDKAEP